MSDKWLPVVDWEGYYEVSDQGEVRSLDRTVTLKNGRRRRYKGQVLSPGCHSNGVYRFVLLSRPECTQNRTVHSLVAHAFLGPRPDGMEVRHLNGQGYDNRAVNLAYGTKLENENDKRLHLTNASTKKTHCPRRHPLSHPNLKSSDFARGIRNCLSCSRALDYLRRHPGDDLKAVSDRYYERIVQ